jgi:exosortase
VTEPQTSAPPALAPRGGVLRALRPWLPAAALAVAFVVLFLPILAVRARYYDDNARYSHCLLLPAVSALWVWDRWDRLRAVPRGASGGGMLLVGLGVLLYLYGRVLPMNLMQHVAMLVTLTGLVWGLLGRRVLWALAFPLGYLALTVPLPKTWDDAVTQPLQTLATTVSAGVFDALGWVVVRQGNVIQLPGLKLLVEEACSGVHSLYALVALGVAWAAFVERPAWLRVTLVLATVPISVLANSIRVIGTGVLAYRVDPSYAEGVSHTTAGMLVFGIGLVLLLLVDWCLKPDAPPDGPTERPTDGRPGGDLARAARPDGA